MDKLAIEIITGMRPWFKYKLPKYTDNSKRTPEQKAWDSAILCAAEYVRRRMNYNKKIPLELCELLSDKLPD